MFAYPNALWLPRVYLSNRSIAIRIIVGSVDDRYVERNSGEQSLDIGNATKGNRYDDYFDIFYCIIRADRCRADFFRQRTNCVGASGVPELDLVTRQGKLACQRGSDVTRTNNSNLHTAS